MGSEVEEDVLDEAAEGFVGHPEVEADDGDGDDDDDRRREDLSPSGPLDLPKLADGLADEPAETALTLALAPGLALRLLDRAHLSAAHSRAIGSGRRLRGRLVVAAASAGLSRHLSCLPVRRVPAAPAAVLL